MCDLLISLLYASRVTEGVAFYAQLRRIAEYVAGFLLLKKKLANQPFSYIYLSRFQVEPG